MPTFYALEGFLTRLARSTYASDFVLKGGVLIAAFTARRPTRDIDLSAVRVPNDVDEVEMRVKDIIALHSEDGLAFDPESVSGQVIRDEADYTGVRVALTASLITARIALHVDVNFGDPVWPGPQITDVPLLLGGTVRLRGYPDHMVLAEKIVTAIDRGTANTRWRDFVDIAAIIAARAVKQADLRTAIEAVANYRRVRLVPVATVLGDMAEVAQPKWEVWRRKQRLEGVTPEHLQELLDQCIPFADGVFGDSAAGTTWSPRKRAWV
jgi:nucleotidyltransferase AbiEii toxin of type IV toxin-antitoxin system